MQHIFNLKYFQMCVSSTFVWIGFFYLSILLQSLIVSLESDNSMWRVYSLCGLRRNQMSLPQVSKTS